jgi:CDP-glucose 4,6-dehydratase
MELMNMKKELAGAYRGSKVLLTGHTGFKGGWLALWLESLGAEVVGYGLEPPTKPSLFDEAKISSLIEDVRGDVLDQKHLLNVIEIHRPEFIFHLAAQPLVKRSYKDPKDTFNVNIMGTVNLLESIRESQIPTVCVCITSDKCYENKEWCYAYRENDPLGGFDPYSASKGAAEIVIASYRRSFFNSDSRSQNIAISSVRAGNIIGGGDWAEDRIVPDCIRSLSTGSPVRIRNPGAVRPWQFILDPLLGYLYLGQKMKNNPGSYAESWNFGPNYSNTINVQQLADRIILEWGHGHYELPSLEENDAHHEATMLMLDIAKTVTKLGWKPVYNIEETVQKTVAWYKNYYEKMENVRVFSLHQIDDFMKEAGKSFQG